MPNYEIIASLPDGQEYYFHSSCKPFFETIENFAECLDADGNFKINGTKYFWCVPGHSEKLFRMTAYGGYEPGGRGCFYQEIKEDETP